MSPTSTSKGAALPVGAEAGIGVGVSLAGLAILGGLIWFVLRIQRRRRAPVVDLYFQKPELDGHDKDGWPSREATKVREPQLRHELDAETRWELPSRMPAGVA